MGFKLAEVKKGLKETSNLHKAADRLIRTKIPSSPLMADGTNEKHVEQLVRMGLEVADLKKTSNLHGAADRLIKKCIFIPKC